MSRLEDSLQDSLQERTFTTHDGLNLWGRHWAAQAIRHERRPHSLVIVHGVGEHSGRYRTLVDHLTHAGFPVHAFDLRGHGRSEGRRVHVEQWEDYLRDVAGFLGEVARITENAPVVLYGHSLGSLIVLDYLIQSTYSESSPQAMQADSISIRGAILSGVPLRPVATAKPHLILAAQVLSRVWPTCRLPLNVDPEALSRDPAVVQAYREDPLVQWKGTARWGREALMAWKRACRELGRVSCPVLILHGEADRVSAAEGSRQLFAHVNSRDKRLRIYPAGTHEPHNDLGSARVLADVQEWLEELQLARGA